MLISGRAKLIEDDNGIRYKVKTIDSNEIDTLFIDNRSDNVGNGKTLVICSEGNAGFYEVGIMGTPIALKYSVLGWNHPGFAGSTGSPHPDQDKMPSMLLFGLRTINWALLLKISYCMAGVLVDSAPCGLHQAIRKSREWCVYYRNMIAYSL